MWPRYLVTSAHAVVRVPACMLALVCMLQINALQQCHDRNCLLSFESMLCIPCYLHTCILSSSFFLGGGLK